MSEPEQILKNRIRLERLCRELDVEMDGVQVPQAAAAILNGIRGVIEDLDSLYEEWKENDER